MLPKKNRADKKAVEKVFKSGRFLNSPSLTFKFILNKGAKIPQISFVASKTIAKKAVDRNSLRRRGYRILRKHIKHFPSELIGVFLFRKNQSDSLIIENEIKNILSKIN